MEVKEFISHEVSVTKIHVQTEQDSEVVGKPCGQYITLETGPLDALVSAENICACLIDQLRPLLVPFFGKTLCVCGIGNNQVPSDSLGPETAKRFCPQMYSAIPRNSNFDKIAVICPGTSAQTSLSSETIISSVASQVGAACILTVDACICKDAERLCSTIQITDSGMQTYWETVVLRRSTLGIPVISIVVPTTVRAADLLLKADLNSSCILTPAHILDVIKAASFIIACSITQVAYPELDYETCKRYIEFSLHGII